MNLVVVIVALASFTACRGSSATVDAMPSELGATAPTVSGVVTAHAVGSGSAVAGVSVVVYDLAHDVVMTSAVTDAAGTFSFTLEPGADVTLNATAAGFIETDYNFPTPLFQSASAAIDLFTPPTYAQLFSAAGVSAMPDYGAIEVDTVNPAWELHTPGIVTNQPPSGTVTYDGANDQPDQPRITRPAATATPTSSTPARAR